MAVYTLPFALAEAAGKQINFLNPTSIIGTIVIVVAFAINFWTTGPQDY